MSEEMTLPESLERLEISSETCYCHILTSEDTNVSASSSKVQTSSSPENDGSENPEYFLENLSIGSFCPKGNCLCNKKRNRKRLANKKTLRRLSRSVLRAPILRLPGTNGGELAAISPSGNRDGARSLASRLLESNVSCKLKEELEIGEEWYHQMPSSSSIATKEDQKATQSTCCSVQARLGYDSTNPTAPVSDDTSMDELASYFDIFVHIPKKMSRMAEMMYI